MLVTLCGLQLYSGLALIITKGPAITGLPETFSNIANGKLLGVPIGAIVFVLSAILCVIYFITRYSGKVYI
jgi:simple sugar transport system permease protein